MSSESTENFTRLFKFSFKDVVFDTNDGTGEDKSLGFFLNQKYGKLRLEVRAKDEKEALRMAVEQLSQSSGYEVIDADYDVQIS